MLTLLMTLIQHHPRGAPLTDEVLDRCGYSGADRENRMRAVRRDIKQLTDRGWRIEQVRPPGEDGRWRVVHVDPRLEATIRDEGQRAQLARAARAAGATQAADLLAPATTDAAPMLSIGLRKTAHGLEEWLAAIRHRCLVDIREGQRQRTLAPRAVLSGPGGWYVVADDLDKGERRYFRLDRLGMAKLRSQDPAPEPLDDDAGLDALNPLSWAVDPPLHAVVVHDRRAAPLVQRLLGDPVETIDRPEGTATTVRVTNRAAFIDGVLQAGEHVRLESPDALRGLLGDRLRSVAGGAR